MSRGETEQEAPSSRSSTLTDSPRQGSRQAGPRSALSSLLTALHTSHLLEQAEPSPLLSAPPHLTDLLS